MNFQIRNRFNGLAAEFAGKEYWLQLGFAVKKAFSSGADLSEVDLSGAYLHGAYLSGAKGTADLAIAKTRILPEGELIGWKKCRNGVIVKLRIPEAAKRSHAFGRKCRAEYADCLEVFGAAVGISLHDGKTEYRAGSRIIPSAFDERWEEECGTGIHFYITRAEAEDHI